MRRLASLNRCVGVDNDGADRIESKDVRDVAIGSYPSTESGRVDEQFTLVELRVASFDVCC